MPWCPPFPFIFKNLRVAYQMRRTLLSLLVFLTSLYSYAQVTTDPELVIADQEVTITVDVSGTDLAGYTGDVWIWSWIERAAGDIDAPTNVNPATDGQDAAKMTRSDDDGDKYSITLTLTEFFDRPAEDFEKVGLLLKGKDWNDGKTPDYEIAVLSGQFEISFTSPTTFPIIVNIGEEISITASATEAADLSIMIDGQEVNSVSNATTISYTEQASIAGKHEVKATADNGTDQSEASFFYTVRTSTVEESRPVGIVDGINYSSDHSAVTLSLCAPMKSSVYVVGDFSNWGVDPTYQMKKDGDHFWIEIEDLTAGEEYAYQYLVDETIWIADPYADKILDLDDKWIADATYPDLKKYPDGAVHSKWYENRAAVFQTNQTPYEWQNTNFEKPDKENLIIYELLVRDFLGSDNMNYQALIDTLDYIEGLGVNAIELMPIMEFNSNDSWGYNPTFMLAVDKAYGTKNDLKAFIDEAHGRGIAVILDMVMNQNDMPSPYAMMYFDHTAGKPLTGNPWFNRDAKHPFNVFFDINHESQYTQVWLDSINHYWLNEFHFDGYRFDLSKGFTQINSGGNVSQWGRKDDTRIALLKRMADKIWSHSPDAYVILEHFADNTEERELAEYGMMLWGNVSHNYKEANLGYGEGKSIDWAYAKERGWPSNHLISYMESHDEERQMYEMLNYGSTFGSYNIKDLGTALQRLKMSAAFFFTIPGPKMLWQWGEYGYDVSINENGRTGRKEPKWNYLQEAGRRAVYNSYQEIIGLRHRYDVFNSGDFSWQPDNEGKSIHISNAEMAVTIVGNFGVESMSLNPEFQHAGTWYDFFSGNELEVSNTNANISLAPGEFHIYTDVKLHTPAKDIITEVEFEEGNTFSLYPNPTTGSLNLQLKDGYNQSWRIIDVLGKEVLRGNTKRNVEEIPVAQLKSGVYTLVCGSETRKFIKL